MIDRRWIARNLKRPGLAFAKIDIPGWVERQDQRSCRLRFELWPLEALAVHLPADTRRACHPKPAETDW